MKASLGNTSLRLKLWLYPTNFACLPFQTASRNCIYSNLFLFFYPSHMLKVCRHVFVIFPVNLATCFWTSYDNRLFKCESRSDVSLSTAIMQKWNLLDFEWLNNFSVKNIKFTFWWCLETNPNKAPEGKGKNVMKQWGFKGRSSYINLRL